MAAKIAKKYTLEELKTMMEERGYLCKDFNPDPNSTRSRSWYYRNRKKVEISNFWHIDHPGIIFYKLRENV